MSLDGTDEHSSGPCEIGPGFEHRLVDVGPVRIQTSIGGSGAPVLLLHGYPQNHLMWRHLAPVLAQQRTVVVADLRGYGDSDAPAPDADGSTYSKRTMAADQVELMHRLGFDEFTVIAHDRGARVAHRLLLDHPDRVDRAALLDIVPTRHVYGHVDRGLATAYYHWFLLATGHGIPEHLLKQDPGFWVRSLIEPLLGRGSHIDTATMADYIRTFTPATIDATCADYRAGASIDLTHDDETRARGQRIEIPVLALWGDQSWVGRGYDTLAVWQEYAADVRGHSLPSGHFVAEEQPELLERALTDWLT